MRQVVLLSLSLMIGCGSPILSHKSSQSVTPNTSKPSAPVEQTRPTQPQLEKPSETQKPSEQQKPDCALEFTKLDKPLCATIAFDAQPKIGEDSVFTLRFWDRADDQKYVTPSNTFRVFLWMPDMGHGSSPVKVEKSTEGVFSVRQVYFTMGGKWLVRVQFRDGKEVLDEQELEVSL